MPETRRPFDDEVRDPFEDDETLRDPWEDDKPEAPKPKPEPKPKTDKKV